VLCAGFMWAILIQRVRIRLTDNFNCHMEVTTFGFSRRSQLAGIECEIKIAS